MTSTSERRLVFLDANVLAAPTTRSLILRATEHRETGFAVCWTLRAEAEADEALIRRAAERGKRLGRMIPPVLVSTLRQRLDWGGQVIVPEAPELEASLTDTDAGDRHILAAASAARAGAVITVDVDDFGQKDLARLGLSAANPDLFLSWVMTPAAYKMALESIAAGRTLPPNTPETIHATLAKGHPRLVEAMQQVYPGVEPVLSAATPPAELFRGNCCLVCGKTLTDPESLAIGVGPECRKQ